jgi:hypothetical protein
MRTRLKLLGTPVEPWVAEQAPRAIVLRHHVLLLLVLLTF